MVSISLDPHELSPWFKDRSFQHVGHNYYSLGKLLFIHITATASVYDCIIVLCKSGESRAYNILNSCNTLLLLLLLLGV